MKFAKLFFLFFISTSSVLGNDSIAGNWRGVILGHTDNKDYFLNAKIDSSKVTDEYVIQLKIFNDDYEGKFTINVLKQNNTKLFIQSFMIKSEFPKAISHIEDCFTGYFQLKSDSVKSYILDLYRNPILRNIDDFTQLDSNGNFIPTFECFTSVLLFPVIKDTSFLSLETKSDSVLSAKKNASKEFSKRKVVSSKEWTVKQEKIILKVWDNNKEDGDIISLKFNDTWILTDFLLKKEKYVIELDLKDKENYLLMFAENLGSIPPNTASISIDDNVLIRTFILNSDMNKSETVKIILNK